MCVCMQVRLNVYEILDQISGFLKKKKKMSKSLLHYHVATHHQNKTLSKKKGFPLAFVLQQIRL